MSPSKLTDTQLVLLSAAAQRDDGAIDPAEGPKGGHAKKAISKLLTDGLVEEVAAGGMLPVWQRNGAFSVERTPLRPKGEGWHLGSAPSASQRVSKKTERSAGSRRIFFMDRGTRGGRSALSR
jgi:hypothetical protein